MAKGPGYAADFVTHFLHEWLPGVLRDAEEGGREVVQTVVWIVGLSSGLLALLATKPAIVASLSGVGTALLSGSLAAAIGLGVLQRVVYGIAERGTRLHLSGLGTYVAGMTSDVALPIPLEGWWDKARIVQQLKEDFGLNYDFLLKPEVTLESAREAYQGQYALWEEHDKQRLGSISKVVAPYLGTDAAQIQQWLSPSPNQAESDEKIRRSARTYARLHTMAFWLFVAACGGFLVALLMLAAVVTGA